MRCTFGRQRAHSCRVQKAQAMIRGVLNHASSLTLVGDPRGAVQARASLALDGVASSRLVIADHFEADTG